MNPNDIEKVAIARYTMGSELIRDLGEALNILAIHGDDCLYAIHSSIRGAAYQKYLESKNNE